MIVTGANYEGEGTSAEVLSAAGTPLCTLPPLPRAGEFGRYEHTQDGLLTCGGGGTPTTCVKLSDAAGGWVESHSFRTPRFRHSSWMSPAGLVLMGGFSGFASTTELLSSSNSSTSYNFTLTISPQLVQI